MFRRSEEEIIKIVGEAFKAGQVITKNNFNLQTEYNSNLKWLYHKLVCESSNTIVLQTLLDYLGLEFKKENNVIVKKQNIKKGGK